MNFAAGRGLLERGCGLSEAPAAETLRLLDARQDPLPAGKTTHRWKTRTSPPEEEASVQEARDELAAAADLISHEEIKREFGIT